MKHIAAKLIRALCGITAMLVLVTGIAFIPANALDNGIYLATATPHYKHPTTGKIEDSGGEKSKVLGQSMTESALHNEALVEVDPQGNTYITVRLNLMDNIESPKFSVDAARNGSFTAVSATVMQEDFTENTTDFRMQVKDENVILRCAMYVVPMGRDVVFYITVSDLRSGSGDFITSVKVTSTTKETSKPAENSKSSEVSKPVQTSKPAESSKAPETSKPAQTSKPAESSKSPETSKPAQTSKPAETSKVPQQSKTTEVSNAPESTAPAEVSAVQSSVPESAEPSEASKTSESSKVSEPSKTSEVSEKSKTSETSDVSETEETTSAVSEPSEQSSQADTGEAAESSDSSETVGLTEFDAQGSEVKEISSEPDEQNDTGTTPWLIIGIGAVAVVVCISIFLILKKTRGKNHD